MTSPAVAFRRIARSPMVIVSPTVMVIGLFLVV